MENKDNIENLFSEKFKGFSPEISDAFTKKIELEATKATKNIRSKKRFKTLGVITTTIVISLLSYFIYSPFNYKNHNLETKDKTTDKTQDFLDTSFANSNELITLKKNLELEENNTIELPKDVFEKEFLNQIEEDTIQKVKQTTTIIETTKNKNNLTPHYENSSLGKALYSIDRLKTGAILVRLKTKAKTIEAYRTRGYEKQAKAIEQELMEENLMLYNAFQENFKFCKLYFFYSSETNAIQKKQFKGVFLNSKLKTDSSIVLNENYYLIADIGQAKSTDFEAEKNIELHQNNGLLSRVIVLSNSDFIQMEAPFPYYQKALSPAKDENNIRKMDQKFNKFFLKRGN